MGNEEKEKKKKKKTRPIKKKHFVELTPPPPFHPISETFLFRMQENGRRAETHNSSYTTLLGDQVPEAQWDRCILSTCHSLLPASPALSYANNPNCTN